MQDRQPHSIALDTTPSNNSISITGDGDHLYQAMAVEKPEELELKFDSQGNVIGCSYKGYSSHRVVEYLKGSKRSQMTEETVQRVVIAVLFLAVLIFSFTLARSMTKPAYSNSHSGIANNESNV